MPVSLFARIKNPIAFLVSARLHVNQGWSCSSSEGGGNSNKTSSEEEALMHFSHNNDGLKSAL